MMRLIAGASRGIGLSLAMKAQKSFVLEHYGML